uniref:Uncharacterized protein n=1 Tax=Pavo cristatus TaxID=9049 RepID=A0A8C9LBX5_PAVCR
RLEWPLKPTQSQPTQAAQGPIQPGLEHLQGWGTHSFSGQPVPLNTENAHLHPGPSLAAYCIVLWHRQIYNLIRHIHARSKGISRDLSLLLSKQSTTESEISLKTLRKY